MDHADRLGAPVFRNAVAPFLPLYEKERSTLMSIQTILASGFLLLGGIFRPIGRLRSAG